ncbi:28550_t:CDS:2 [Racocetra persica]|uniref:28550_t:CDS:1 n=1 Tax=Racocetra persica TaxID=160502 RepID=A0ACA9KAU3_9GLOM|nr:28550_t:CDS:2 [Racocetra persica]
MSSQERSTSPISLEDEVSWLPQESTVYSPVSNNEINNEANNEHLYTTEFLNHDRKKRRMIKTTKPSAFSTPIQINSSRTNASYTRFFFEDNKKDNQIKYCKICVKKYEETRTKPYPYSKSGGSTGHLTYHLRERHNITANNYKEHLDSSQEPIVKVNLITNYITNLPPLSTKRQNELTKVLIEFIVLVDVLKPFEEITRHFSGSKYPTINLIYPYICMLKNKYAPRVENGESFEKWIALIYGSLPENSKQISENLSDDDTSISSGDEANIPAAGTRQQWQYAHRSIHSRGRGQGCRSGKHKRRVKSVAELDNTNNIKYLPPTKCEGLLEKMCAAIYLSLDELWSIPDEIGLKASMLDSRVLKLLPFATEDERRNTKAQIRAELSILEAQFRQNNDKIEACITTEEEEYDSLSAELWGSLSTPTPQTITEDELTKYLKEQIAHKTQDPLIWWKERRANFLLLSQLARKYLAVPAISVPSERLFSDAGALISARRTRLAPDLVNMMLFLKRNYPFLENK